MSKIILSLNSALAMARSETAAWERANAEYWAAEAAHTKAVTETDELWQSMYDASPIPALEAEAKYMYDCPELDVLHSRIDAEYAILRNNATYVRDTQWVERLYQKSRDVYARDSARIERAERDKSAANEKYYEMLCVARKLSDKNVDFRRQYLLTIHGQG